MLDQLNQSLSLIIQQTQNNTHHLLIMCGVIWGVFILTQLIPGLLTLGIIPRRVRGLPGIVCAPFLHANFNHIFFNTIPLVVLSNFILVYGMSFFLQVSAYIILLSGLAVWVFAKPAIHIGASALITGYWGFLITDAYQQPSVTSLILGMISIYYFAGIFFGVFPGKKGVSWEGHLFGLLSGFAVGYYL